MLQLVGFTSATDVVLILSYTEYIYEIAEQVSNSNTRACCICAPRVACRRSLSEAARHAHRQQRLQTVPRSARRIAHPTQPVFFFFLSLLLSLACCSASLLFRSHFVSLARYFFFSFWLPPLRCRSVCLPLGPSRRRAWTSGCLPRPVGLRGTRRGPGKRWRRRNGARRSLRRP